MAGGPEATWYPETFLRDDGADLCMLGEGEVVFAELGNWAWRKFKAAPDNMAFPIAYPSSCPDSNGILYWSVIRGYESCMEIHP